MCCLVFDLDMLDLCSCGENCLSLINSKLDVFDKLRAPNDVAAPLALLFELVNVEFAPSPEIRGNDGTKSLKDWGLSGNEFLEVVLSIGRHAGLISESNLDPEVKVSFFASGDPSSWLVSGSQNIRLRECGAS